MAKVLFPAVLLNRVSVYELHSKSIRLIDNQLLTSHNKSMDNKLPVVINALSGLISQFLEYLEIDPTKTYFSPFQFYSNTAQRAFWRGKEKLQK